MTIRWPNSHLLSSAPQNQLGRKVASMHFLRLLWSLTIMLPIARAFQTAFVSSGARSYHSTRLMARKAGVASPEELKAFVASAGDKLVVVDVRNPDADMEPGDQKSLAVAGLPSDTFRPKAVSLIWNRETGDMPVPDFPKDTPMITHCGGGGRGQKAKDFLAEKGFTNILNGGGPKETDCWAEYGDK